MRYLLLLICLLLICCVNVHTEEPDLSGLEVTCGTEESPYYLFDITNSSDSITLAVRFYNFLPESSGFFRDEATFKKSIDKLNDAFKIAGIQFELIEVITISDDYFYFNQKDYIQHWGILDRELYAERKTPALNVMVYPPDTKIFPGAATGINSNAFCIQSQYLTGSTIVHEAAHCLGLYHTHQNDNTDGRSYTSGDYMCDLAYHPVLVNNVKDSCDAIIRPHADISDSEESDLVKNWMSYTLFKCRSSFSDDQIAKMRQTIMTTPHHRLSLL